MISEIKLKLRKFETRLNQLIFKIFKYIQSIYHIQLKSLVGPISLYSKQESQN